MIYGLNAAREDKEPELQEPSWLIYSGNLLSLTGKLFPRLSSRPIVYAEASHLEWKMLFADDISLFSSFLIYYDLLAARAHERENFLLLNERASE